MLGYKQATIQVHEFNVTTTMLLYGYNARFLYIDASISCKVRAGMSPCVSVSIMMTFNVYDYFCILIWPLVGKCCF